MTEEHIYEDFKKDQTQVRKRLLRILIQEPLTIKELAERIGIERLTLTRFYVKNVDVADITLLKILNYLERKEAQYNIKHKDT